LKRTSENLPTDRETVNNRNISVYLGFPMLEPTTENQNWLAHPSLHFWHTKTKLLIFSEDLIDHSQTQI
jgi:hypothetical protein